MRSPLDTSTLLLAAVAVVLAIVAYLKDPASYHGWWWPSCWQASCGICALLLAILAGVVTPGDPVTVASFTFPLIAGWLVSVFSHE